MMKLLFLILIGGGLVAARRKLDFKNYKRDTKKCPIGIGWFTNAQECKGDATKCAHADNVDYKGKKLTIYAGCQPTSACGNKYTLSEQTLKVKCTALGEKKTCKQGSEENNEQDTCDKSATHCAHFPDVTAWDVKLGNIYAGCRTDCVDDKEEKYGPVTGTVTCRDPPTQKPEPATTTAPKSHSSVIQPFTFITLVVSSMMAMLSL